MTPHAKDGITVGNATATARTATVTATAATPPSKTKTKKRISKSERKRRKRAKEQQQLLLQEQEQQNGIHTQTTEDDTPSLQSTKSNETNESRSKPTTPIPSPKPTPTPTPTLTKIANDIKNNNNNNNNSDATTTKLNLVNEVSMTSRQVSFVYPQKDKPSSITGKPVSYIHSKLRKKKSGRAGNGTNGKDDGDGDGNGNGEDDQSVDEEVEALRNDTIEDILFPQKKKRKKEAEAEIEKKNADKETKDKAKAKAKAIDRKEIQSPSDRKKRKKDEMVEEEDAQMQVQEAQSQGIIESESTSQPTTPTPIPKKKKKKEVTTKESKADKKNVPNPNVNDEANANANASANVTTEEIPKHGRSRSDSLCDPMKSRLSGRTVEDAIKDKSGRRPRSNSTDGELKLPKRGLCDERMVIRNYKWDHDVFKSAPPRGFINLGNTCFLNSTLQCLTYLPTFCQCVAMLPLPSCPSNSIESGNGQSQSQSQGQKKKKQKGNSGRQMTTFLRNLMRRVHGLDGEVKQAPLAPKAIVRSISTLGGGSHQGYKFRPGRQEDAHEFLVHLLDAMNDGELRAAGIDQNKSGWRDRLPIPRLDETTLTHRMFGGYLRSQVRCTKCKYNSNTYDPFLDLSLEVSGKKVHSLHDALSEFTRKETLDAANKWKCSGCKKRVCATKQLTIFRPPLTLCIQLKRFTFGGGFGGFMQHQGFSHFAGKGMGRKGGSKVQKLIEFPATLKLPLSDGRKCEYILTGVIVHIGGSATSGHYTAFVRRTSKKGKTQWLNMDDSFVEPVSEKTVLRNDDAYVLFYCRKEVDLELPSLPGRSFDSAEDAVKAVKAKSKSKIKSPTDNSMLMSETKEKGIPVTPESIKKKSKGAKMQVTLSNKDARKKPTSDVKKDVTTQQSPEKAKKESRNVSKEEDKREIASSAAAHNSVTSKHSEASDDTPTPNAGALDSTESSSRLEQVDSTSASAVEGQKSPGEKKKRKKTDITIDLGSRGKVNVKLGKLKNRKPWKSPSVAKSSEDKSHLLGNKTISGWDDEDEGGGDADTDADARTVNKKQKAKKLRESVFKESKQKAKDRKRKMYLNSWDAGLDSGKTKKVRDREPNWYDEKAPEENNPFHRIQESLSKMRGGRKGQNTSMKKRKLNK